MGFRRFWASVEFLAVTVCRRCQTFRNQRGDPRVLEALEARCRHWQAYVFSLRTVGSSRPELRDASAEANLKHVQFHRLVGRGNAALVAALAVAM